MFIHVFVIRRFLIILHYHVGGRSFIESFPDILSTLFNLMCDSVCADGDCKTFSWVCTANTAPTGK